MAGSIEKRGKDSFRLVVSVGYDQNGKQIKRTKTVKANGKREAEKLLAQFVTEIEAGEFIEPSKMTLSRFVDEWKSKFAVKHLSPSTIEKYYLQLENRILPSIGHLKLDSIKPFNIMTFLDELSKVTIVHKGVEKTLSPSTIYDYYKLLKNIFSKAVDWQVIKSNPVASVKQPKIPKKMTNVFDKKNVLKLYEALEQEELRWQVFIKLAVTCGLRRGELLGLEWSNVDLEKGIINVRQALTYTKNDGFIVKEPKTHNSVRSISLPSSIIPELKKLKMQCNKKRLHANDLWESGKYFFLFSAWNGKPLHPSSVKTWWKRFTTRHNLPYIRFHDLRHTSATILINEGAHMKTISARLGHGSISTTMNIYGHVLEEADKKVADLFDIFLEKEC